MVSRTTSLLDSLQVCQYEPGHDWLDLVKSLRD
jgi:hypothetical protein